jgi:D-amino peptidase
MLNVYISADIEGVNNVIYPHQIENSGDDSYSWVIKQQHNELNSIIEGLLENKADKITINDAHGIMENLNVADLNPKVELISGKPKPVSMLFGLDDSYSCVFFTGYHAKADSDKGILAHTFSHIFKQLKINGVTIGEIELNAIYTGLLNIPIALVTGDNITCDEAVDVLGNIKTVTTKTAISTTAAKCKPNEELFKELKLAAKEAVQNPGSWILYKKNPPYILEVDFKDRSNADIAEFLPNVKKISSSAIEFKSGDYKEIYKLLQFLSATLSRK